MPTDQLPDPVIMVPGITATVLRDFYDLPPTGIWGIMTQNFERVALHPEDRRYEAALPAQVRAEEALELAYREMVLDLRHDLTAKKDRPVPVYSFGYDWRQPLEQSQAQLAAFVTEVIEKTCLTRHYHEDGYLNRRRVNLLGHSMGGMIITGYLSDELKAGRKPRVNRVATVVTPFRGSLKAVEKLILGTTNRREREAARLTPSLYYLLPSFTEHIAIAPSLPQSFFDVKFWQQGVLETVQEALRVYGSGEVAATAANAKKVLDAMLDAAKAHRAMMEAFVPAGTGLKAEDWLCVRGYGNKTRFGLKVDDTPAGPIFDLLDDSLIGDEDQPSFRTGDGTVPWAGSKAAFPVVEQALSPKDFRILELEEKVLMMKADLHAIIPNMDKLQGHLRNHFAVRRP